ncbi:MAG: AAA family ATPase [Caldilineaceae bacterium]|nr:AAA family ATPase [Caldilineaceae bacterium]
MQLKIPRVSKDPLIISLGQGQQLYIVGANGTGKSALFQYWVSSVGNSQFKRIAAHRQTWLPSGNLTLTAQTRKQFETNRMHWETQEDSRWMDKDPTQRQSAILFDLVAKDNTRARTIVQYIDDNQQSKADELANKSISLFRQLNHLLNLGTFEISLENSNDEEILALRQDSNLRYSMVRMSDGERAAAIMAADVLVANPGTVFLIDEPERHLHRSIIEPFLTALFSQRQDCVFVISTHEIALPIANPTAQIMMLRSCRWHGNQPIAWDTELLESGEHLPEGLRRDILGSRQRILFVEGTANSLDLPLYGALFSELSVIPKGSCEDVIRAVKGLRSTYGHHHVEVFGLIDKDDRTKDEVCELSQSNIFALEVHSVESLYYCSDAIYAVARRQAELLRHKSNEMISAATQNALKVITDTSNLPERMAARRSERLVFNRFRTQMPDWKEIKATGKQFVNIEPIDNPFQDELDIFNHLHENGDLNGLIARYPLSESDVFDQIAQALEFRKRKVYERVVVTCVHDDESLARKLKDRIGPLAELLGVQNNHDS